ncbi:MAG: YdeI/OmpD-associated family protein [Fluviicola sp.]|nr:YdeI/OmpD-associated family protein [Fluviicola sp.]
MENKQYTIEKEEGSRFFIILDNKLAESLTVNGNKRIVCTINNTDAFHAALTNKKGVGYCVYIRGALGKDLKLQEGKEIRALVNIDDSPNQFEMPEELLEVLRTDPEAEGIFGSLTPGNQRGLIYLVTQVKSTDKRIERALRVAKCIKMGIKAPQLVMKSKL